MDPGGKKSNHPDTEKHDSAKAEKLTADLKKCLKGKSKRRIKKMKRIKIPFKINKQHKKLKGKKIRTCQQ